MIVVIAAVSQAVIVRRFVETRTLICSAIGFCSRSENKLAMPISLQLAASMRKRENLPYVNKAFCYVRTKSQVSHRFGMGIN